MNTLRKIWEHIYSNWLTTIIILISLAHYCFGATWKWMWLPVAMFVLGLAAMNLPYKFFAPIRTLLWPVIRIRLIEKITNVQGNIFSYPMILWVEMEARAPFIQGGWCELQRVMNNHLEGISDTLNSVFSLTPSKD